MNVVESKRSRATPGGREEEARWLEAPAQPGARVELDLDRLLRTAPRALAAALIDVSTGAALGFRSFDNRIDRDIDLFAEGSSELFRDLSLIAIESMDLGLLEGAGERREAIQKVIVQTHSLLYVLIRAPGRPKLVLATVCWSDANLGMVQLAAREALKELGAAS